MVDERNCVNCVHFEVCAYVDPLLPVCDSYAEPVKHGRWIGVQNGCGCCSNCHRQDGIDPIATHCRYCGAKMDVGADHED